MNKKYRTSINCLLLTSFLFSCTFPPIKLEDISPLVTQNPGGKLFWLMDPTVDLPPSQWTTQPVSVEVYKAAISGAMVSAQMKAPTIENALAKIQVSHYGRTPSFPSSVSSVWLTNHRLQIYDNSNQVQLAEMHFKGHTFVDVSFARTGIEGMAFSYSKSIQDGIEQMITELGSEKLARYIDRMRALIPEFKPGLTLAQVSKYGVLSAPRTRPNQENTLDTALFYFRAGTVDATLNPSLELKICGFTDESSCKSLSGSEASDYLKRFSEVIDRYFYLNRPNEYIRFIFDKNEVLRGWDWQTGGPLSPPVEGGTQDSIPEIDLVSISVCVLEKGPLLDCADIDRTEKHTAN